MKKMLATMLAVVMALSLSATAFAAEPDTIGIIGGADGPTAILISPMPGGLEDADAALDEDALAAQQQMMIEAAKSLMPYQEGVNVWLNGSYMTFTDAVPVVRDGRTQVPFRAILEALGAEVAYDDGRIEAVFADGSVMKLAIGSKTMTYAHGENNAEVTTVEMDVAPYIDYSCGRTYVPVRFIGETLGLTVTWDPDLWVAYIVDWDALVDEIDGSFAKFNEMMTVASAQQAETDQAYKSTDSITLSGVLEDQSRKAFKISLTGASITKGENASGTYEIGVDLGGYQSVAEAAGLAEAAELLDGQKIDMIVHAENGIFLRSDLVTLLTGGMVAENSWLKIGAMDDLYAASGIDMTNLMAQATQPGFTMGRLVRALCENGEMGRLMGYMAPDSAARLFAGLYEGMFGDDAMKVTGTGTTKTYICAFDMNSVLDGMAKAGLLPEEELKEAKAEMREMGMTMDFTMKMTAKNGKATKSSADMTMKVEGIAMTMDMDAVNNSATGNITLAVDGVGDFRLDITSKVTATSQDPQTAPAAGESVVTLEELINAFYGSLVR